MSIIEKRLQYLEERVHRLEVIAHLSGYNECSRCKEWRKLMPIKVSVNKGPVEAQSLCDSCETFYISHPEVFELKY